jgi:hypothetical protein
VSCNWTGFDSSDKSPSPQGCLAKATFGTPGPRTLTVNVVDTVIDRFGRQFTQKASASETIVVANQAPGDYITNIIPTPQPVCSALFGCTIPPSPFNGSTVTIAESTFPAGIEIIGEVIPSAGTTTLTATDSSGNTVTIPPQKCINPGICGLNFGGPNGIPFIWSVARADVYTINMKTTDSGGHVTGTATMTVNVVAPPR